MSDDLPPDGSPDPAVPPDCAAARAVLDRARDGEEPGPGLAAAREHAAACAACRAGEAALAAAGGRLRERAAGSADPLLRDAVLARIRAVEAAVPGLRPFLRRAAVAAAAVFVAATAAAFWQASRAPAPGEAGIPREEILAEIVGPLSGAGR